MYTFHIFSWIPYITLHNPNCLIVCWLNGFVLLKGSLAPFVFWTLDKTFHTSCINAYSLASYVVADVTHPDLSFLHDRKRKQTQMTRWLCFYVMSLFFPTCKVRVSRFQQRCSSSSSSSPPPARCDCGHQWTWTLSQAPDAVEHN